MPHTHHLETFIRKAYENHLTILAHEVVRDTLESVGYYGGGFMEDQPLAYLTLARYADAMSEIDDVMDFWGLGDSMDVRPTNPEWEDPSDVYPRDYNMTHESDDC